MDKGKEKIKELIVRIYQGEDIGQLKYEFIDATKGIGSLDIARAEQELINEGMDPEKTKKLCDLHLVAFKDRLGSHKT